MTWNMSATHLDAGAVVAELANQAEAIANSQGGDAGDQARSVVAAVNALLQSGNVGDRKGDGEPMLYQVDCAGHATPAHEDVKGFANETVSIRINQA